MTFPDLTHLAPEHAALFAALYAERNGLPLAVVDRALAAARQPSRHARHAA